MVLKISSITATSAAGVGNTELLNNLQNNRTGLNFSTFDESSALHSWIGEVPGVDQVELVDEWQIFNCRNNRLAFLALQQDGFLASAQALVAKYGAARVAVFLGTSTSGIHDTELAYRQMFADSSKALPAWYHYDQSHNNYSAPRFVANLIGATGPCYTVSTACSSSAKVFANAWRAIESGFCDAAVVGGVDSLCLTTLFGFNSLQLLASGICRPCDAERAGISIGEAAGFATLEPGEGGVMTLYGFGESSDAFHMSSPHPDGDGALSAMQAALQMAGLNANEIDYINMHGTGTKANDLSESRAICRLFHDAVPCSSTKGWTGHTLGAAGILEAAICSLVLNNAFLPISLNTRECDEQIQANIVMESQPSFTANHVLSNSFGFGGSNCSLVFGRS
ncbi:3-oxoacyl-[acyl-carrier-protein] synthase-1 [Alteromonadaceae bacterium 2753L.S.0a.02]|nr:3-oxoacyl-[acyl-carrier-protein] synthase-1 [Alteromonadaceae bacterium 2753L.S.0a.02]